tara:strand:- start:141 stop:674 length:534 start_codon:yes stop_codon:yes gene_type:complete
MLIMNKIKILLITSLLVLMPASVLADGIKVLDGERAMLQTQYAIDESNKFEQDPDFTADRERLELLQTEIQALVDTFQQDQETLSDQEIADMQQKVQDKQTEAQFVAQKLQTKIEQKRGEILQTLTPIFQQVVGELITAQELDMIMPSQTLFYWDPDMDMTDEVTALLDLAVSKAED